MIKSVHFQFFATIVLGFTAQLAFAQTGPGGVGNGTGSSGAARNIIWLDASDLSSPLSDGFTWSDKSGNGYDAIESNSGSNVASLGDINGAAALDFSGVANQHLVIADDQASDNLLDNSTEFSVFVAYTVGTNDPRCIISKRQSFNNSMSWVMFHNNGYKAFSYVSNGTYGGSTTLSQSTNYIQSLRVDGNLSSNSVKLHVNGASAGESGSNVSVADYDDDVIIGLFNSGDNRYFNGKIAEVIVYRDALSDVEFNIMNNYLSAKYQISITGDLYDYESTHRYGLIGIGQASDGSSQTSATGDGILTISSASALGNSEYFMVAHDGNEAELADTCDAPDLYGKRLVRSWKVGHTGDVGTVSFSFDLSGVSGLGSVSDLALIQSSSSDFTDATVHTTGINLVGSTLSFTGVDLNDGDIFTVAQLGSTVVWDGAAWSNGSGGSSAPSAADASKKLVISSSGADLTSDASCECLVVSSGADLALTNDASLSVANGIDNDGSVNVASGASLVQTSDAANSGSGSYMIQRSTGTLNDDTRFQYWSSPIQSATMGAVFTGSNTVDFYYFDEGSTDNWASQGSGATMTPGRGYITTGTIGISNAAETRTFSGDVNNGTVSLSTSSVTSGDNILVGNPYPSAISSTSFVTDNTDINGTLWFWNHFTPESDGDNTDSDYATWTSTGATSGNGATTPDDYVQSCQGFFVEAISSNPTISFTNDQRATGNNTQFFKQQQSDKHRVWLAISNDSNDFNQILIGFLPQATDGADRLYDGKKYKAHPRIAFYSLIDSVDYSIQGLDVPDDLEEKIIPLGVDAWITGTHTIFIDSLDNWPEDYEINLIDELNQTSHDLRENPTYSFNVEQAGEIRDRFAIAVKDNKVDDEPTTVDELAADDMVNVFVANGELMINSESKELKSVTMHDISGRLIFQKEIRGKQIRIPQNHAGVAIVSVKLIDDSSHKQLIYINQ